MAWIESHTVTLRHRKLRELARELRIRPAYMMGHLHALWHAALEQQENGDLSSWSDEFIADQSDFPGDAPQYVRLLQKHRWLGYFNPDGTVVPGSEKLIHDWLDYAGKYLRSKYSTSSRDKLLEIWSRHGRTYNEHGARGQRADSERIATIPTNQPNLPTNPPTGVVAGDLESELRLAGVASSKRLAQCRTVPGLTPVGVALLADQIRAIGSATDVGAVLASTLVEGFVPPKFGPKELYQLAKKGRLYSVCGTVVNGKPVKYGSGKFFVGDTEIPASQLKPENIELTRGENGSAN